MRAVSPVEVQRGAEALVKWLSPAHSVRVPTEMDCAAARAVLSAAALADAVENIEPLRIGPVRVDDPRAGIPTKDEGLTPEHVGWLALCLLCFACGIIVGYLW